MSQSVELININTLVTVLTAAVDSANKANPDCLGIILYGSRTHKGRARTDSDVDMIAIVSDCSISGRIRAAYCLSDKIDLVLKPQLMRSHIKTSISPELISSAEYSKDKMDTLRRKCAGLDCESRIIASGVEIEDGLDRLVHYKRRGWSRAGY